MLSGGQKARVALGLLYAFVCFMLVCLSNVTARAVYSRSQTVLLDDVLSAVDTHTAAALISKCIYGPLMQGRTIILVTHHFASVVNGAAWIVRMQNGSIQAQGSPEELRKTGDLANSTSEVLEAGGRDTVVKEESVARELESATQSEKKKSKLIEDETKSTCVLSPTVRIWADNSLEAMYADMYTLLTCVLPRIGSLPSSSLPFWFANQVVSPRSFG